MVMNKIIGIILLLLGFFTLRYFPDAVRYQRGEFTITGILIGVIMALVGIGLLIFG
jgi:hypothetical protein